MKSRDIEALGQQAKPTIDGVLGQIFRRLEKLDGLFQERGPSPSSSTRRSDGEASEAGLSSQLSQLRDSLKAELDNLTRSVEFAVERTRETCSEELLRRVEKSVLSRIEKAIQDKLDSLTARVLEVGFKSSARTDAQPPKPKRESLSKRYCTAACSQEDALPPQTQAPRPGQPCVSPQQKRASTTQRPAASNIKIQEQTFIVDRPSLDRPAPKQPHKQKPPSVPATQYFASCDAAFKALAHLAHCLAKLADLRRPGKALDRLLKKFLAARLEARSDFEATLENHKKGAIVHSSPERVFGLMLQEEKASQAFRADLAALLIS